jgi:cytochrome c-type biogenesis protein CcsB
MANFENLALTGGIIVLALGLVFPLFSVIFKNPMVKVTTYVNPHTRTIRLYTPSGYTWISLLGLALIFITALIINRAIISGHGPFSNMYEFSVAFSWGIILMSLFFLWRYKLTVIGIIGVIIAISLLLFANTLPSKIIPLVPALRQSVLLSVHVAAAIIAYGALTVGFGSAAVFLLAQRRNSRVTQPEIFDSVSYHTVIIGFPFLTATIILGAIWANIAWGRPWGWDPKETASLVTWLIFAAYLHARVMRGWHGTKSALLLVIGFLAILFTFFGNYIFSGLHSYG